MGKNERKGSRRDRNTRTFTRVPDLGYYLVVTDTKETEKNYFNGIRDSIPTQIRDRLVIKVEKARVIDLVQKAKELRDENVQYRIPWVIFDRDQVKDFDKIIKDADEKEINVGWSNPCIEIWFFAYFGEIPMISDSAICCSEFSKKYKSKVGQEYAKSSSDIYKKLVEYGDERKAFERAKGKMEQLLREGKDKPSEMWPGNKLYELIKEISEKKNI